MEELDVKSLRGRPTPAETLKSEMGVIWSVVALMYPVEYLAPMRSRIFFA